MVLSSWTDGLLLAMVAVCIVTDVKRRKIYNAVLFPVLAAALAMHALADGWQGLALSLKGFGVGLIILLFPFLMGGIGAGDVKLLAVIGALKGSQFVLYTAVGMALIGGIMSAIVLFFDASARTRFRGLLISIYGNICGVRMPLADRAGDSAAAATLPYGVAIGAGAILMLLWGRWTL